MLAGRGTERRKFRKRGRKGSLACTSSFRDTPSCRSTRLIPALSLTDLGTTSSPRCSENPPFAPRFPLLVRFLCPRPFERPDVPRLPPLPLYRICHSSWSRPVIPDSTTYPSLFDFCSLFPPRFPHCLTPCIYASASRLYCSLVRLELLVGICLSRRDWQEEVQKDSSSFSHSRHRSCRCVPRVGWRDKRNRDCLAGS